MADERELTPELARELFGPRDLNVEQPEPPEPEVEGLPPRDKPVSEWTEEESAAFRQSFDRTMREKAKREEREQREAEERRQAELNRTDDQRLGDMIAMDAHPAAKRARDAAFIRSIHGGGDEAA
jgi:hypothetical protein